jgi:hypothetical protein
MAAPATLVQLTANLQKYLDDHPDRPWCVHEMYDAVGSHHEGEDMLVETQRALNHMVRNGTIGSSGMMVERSEGVCDDWFYWSAKSTKRHLDEFGPKWQFPELSEKIQQHCRHRV